MSSPIKFPRLIPTVTALGLGLGLLASTGCASFKLKNPPPGFIEVSASHWEGEGELRMKAPDNVGLNITTFSNRRGGNLAIWADDMIKKLVARGYVLERQSPVKSGNGVEGTRFDFAYEPPGSDDGQKFFTAVLFVTDEWRVVVQLAGQADLAAAHGEDLEKVLGQIKVRGCKVASKVCNSGQPKAYPTTHKAKPNDAAAKTDEDEDDDEDEGKIEAEPDPAPADTEAQPASDAPPSSL